MTAWEAISWIDEKKHNVYSREDKLAWLHRLEVTVHNFMDGYSDCGDISVAPAPEEMDVHGKLLIDAPFDDLYLYHLEAQMDYATREFTKYNNAASMFRAQWEAFTAHYNRTHTHKSVACKF